VLKTFATFVAWISGSLAGISAILYALGFVATKAADQVLGIGFDFATRDPVFYVARGSSLVMRTVIISVWPALAVLGIAATIRWVCGAGSGGGGAAKVSTLRRLAAAVAAPAVSVAMLALALIALAGFVIPALDFEGLLFTHPDPARDCARPNELVTALMLQDHGTLNRTFTQFALCAGFIIGAGIALYPKFLEAGQAAWLAVAGLAGFLTLVGIPIAYGALIVEAAAPSVRITPAPADAAGPTRLLARSNSGALVWLEDEREVLWVSGGAIKSLVIGASRPIVILDCPEPAPSKPGE
jgi:hypothetical protein